MRSLVCSLRGTSATAYGSTFTFNPAWLATYRSASPSGILSKVTVMRAAAEPDTGATAGAAPGRPRTGAPGAAGAPGPGGAPPPPAGGVAVPPGGAIGSTGIEGAAT